ncbi:MarR family transcriptional regulator [Lachnospiraceae bacterium MD1]|jgi:DNA-binding MarR family transcriptional regulator|uniref:MarR family transcriptional regulator n=1 Tax=Variimorphobacter saccharofermentans TaxID=2755051 RepID=A0A839JXR2_9FIRM|nr:MarR family transcriptional regulator [Variimorphobacter saccharofermentans]MBB2182094.1 MarR family transcriptional regulator [Variimorphobacter saccharofermentans]
MEPSVKQLIESLSQVYKTIHQKSYQKMNNMNFYPGQPKLLSLIKHHEGITQKDLSEKTHVTAATITGMLNKLEANHYVYRVPDSTDKRVMRVYLTPEGKHFAEHAERFLISMFEQLFTGFSDEELQTFNHLLEKMKSNLRNSDSKS